MSGSSGMPDRDSAQLSILSNPPEGRTLALDPCSITAAQPSAVRLAPPTSTPSSWGRVSSEATLPELTLPPYRMGTRTVIRSGILAGPDCPYRFVGQHHVLPSLRIERLQDRAGLAQNHRFGAASI